MVDIVLQSPALAILYGHEALSSDCKAAKDWVCDRSLPENEGHLRNTGHHKLRLKKLREVFVDVWIGIC